MKREITLPLGRIQVTKHEDGDTLLYVEAGGAVFVQLKLPPYAAGRLADALEDVNTNRLTLEEATSKKWGVYRSNAAGDGTDTPVLLAEFDTYQAAVQEVGGRQRLDARQQRFTYKYFYQEMEP